jgi:DNA-binding XRE family transcriptional regulator
MKCNKNRFAPVFFSYAFRQPRHSIPAMNEHHGNGRIDGAELKRIRIVMGMTQQQCAAWVGLSISAIAKCEQGYTKLNVNNTNRIRRAMVASVPIKNNLAETIQ